MSRKIPALPRPPPLDFEQDAVNLEMHNRVYATGCVHCGRGSAPGTLALVCPDCYSCHYCGEGCGKCGPARAAITTHPRISPQNRGGNRGK